MARVRDEQGDEIGRRKEGEKREDQEKGRKRGREKGGGVGRLKAAYYSARHCVKRLMELSGGDEAGPARGIGTE